MTKATGKKNPKLQVETTAELLRKFRVATLATGTSMRKVVNNWMAEYVSAYEGHHKKPHAK
jgi:hypothetical protein